ncbi:MAG: DUF1801 domain-containing protein [Chloroflexi bacterium]|nr:DUF1801 domain-containing protein [Chloroflexota bacterium]
MTDRATTVEEYLTEQSLERREALAEVRRVILENLPEGYAEVMQYGMISYVIPLARYPKTYNKQPLAYLSLAAQKRHMSIYLMGVYCDSETESWFVQRYRDSGKRLDMGKACVRFRTLEDLPLDLIGEAVSRTSVEDFIERYETARGSRAKS